MSGFFDKMFSAEKQSTENEKENKVKKLSPIDFVKCLFNKTNLDDVIIEEQYDQFMVNRFLACYQDYRTKKFPYLIMVNCLNDKKMSNLEHFYCLFYKLPKITGEIYLSYFWNRKDEVVLDKKKLIATLKWKFRYNDLGAECALNVITEEEKKYFLDEYEKRMKYIGKEI